MSIIDDGVRFVYSSLMGDEKRQRILKLALETFFQHGYRRVEMKEIAEVAGISRPGLYLYFKTKEEIFNAAILQYAEEKIVEIEENIANEKTVLDKLEYAFEVWAIRGFERSLRSPEAREVSDCSLEFAREALEESYKKLEAIIAGVLKGQPKNSKSRLSASATAHLIVSSTRGFKLVARSGPELRKMIRDLLVLLL